MRAKVWNHNEWINITDPEQIKGIMEAALIDAGFEILKFSEHYFKPQGYTAIWIIAESHLAVHTFPEEGLSYIELTSCGKEKFCKFLDIINYLYLK